MKTHRIRITKINMMVSNGQSYFGKRIVSQRIVGFIVVEVSGTWKYRSTLTSTRLYVGPSVQNLAQAAIFLRKIPQFSLVSRIVQGLWREIEMKPAKP